MSSRSIQRFRAATSVALNHAATPALSNSLLATVVERRAELPLSQELGFLRDALHRFVCGGIYLFAGAPGGGKSLLACQIGLELGRQNHRSLFIVTEQGPSNLKETAIRTTGDWDRATAERALANIQFEDCVYDVTTLPTLVTRSILNPTGQFHGVKLVVLDSIQGHGLAAAATKAYGKVLEAARLLAENGITVILISHITKRGEVAGPKTLEHGVDASLILRRARPELMTLREGMDRATTTIRKQHLEWAAKLALGKQSELPTLSSADYQAILTAHHEYQNLVNHSRSQDHGLPTTQP